MTETTGTLADFDREYDAKTLAIATSAPGSAAVAAVLGIPDDDVTYPFAFGVLRERARVTLLRLRAAEARVAELEAANGVPCYCGWYGPGRDSDAHRREHENA